VRGKGDRLKLFRNHDHSVAIGRAEKLDTRHPDGLYAEWRIFKTPAGDQALVEIAEGALDTFSIGFRAVKAQRGADGAREILEAEIHETSLVPLAAYEGARVLAVRSFGAEDITRWLDEHKIPPPTSTFPELRGYAHRQ
jgi:HK97 family phage prohead protease